MSRYTEQYFYVVLPTATTTDTFGASAVNTGALDLGAFDGKTVSIKLSEAGSVRAGAADTVAATAGDYPFEADRDYVAVINKATRYLSVRGLGTGGTIYVAATSGI